MSSRLVLCAGPAASHGSWLLPDDLREDLVMASDPLRKCIRNAQAAMRQGQLDAAIGWFRHASAIDGTLVLPRVGAAICLLQAGRDADGAQELMQAYAEGGKPGEVDATLARVCMLAGERDAACRAAKDAVASDPAWAQALREDATFRALRDHPAFLQALGEL